MSIKISKCGVKYRAMASGVADGPCTCVGIGTTPSAAITNLVKTHKDRLRLG